MAVTLHPASFWQKLVDDPNSCVKLVRKEWRFALPCCYVEDIKTGIKTFLQTKITRFVPELGGIFAGHGKLSLVTPNVRILFNQPFVYVTVSGDFFIFAPTVGSKLKGIVHKKSPVYLGCLVHGLFNASVPLPANILKQDWVGSKVNLQDEVLFAITKVDVQSTIPYIRGNLLEMTSAFNNVSNGRTDIESHDSGISAAEESFASEPFQAPQIRSQKHKTSKSAKIGYSQTEFGNEEERANVLADETETSFRGKSSKKKKKKEKNVDGASYEESHERNVGKRKLEADDQGSVPAKKRARHSVDQLAANLVSELTSNIMQASFETPKIKKEKKKSKNSLDVSVEDLTRSLLEEVSASFSQPPSPRKKKTASSKKQKSKSEDICHASDLDSTGNSLSRRTESQISIKSEKTPTATPSTEKKTAKKSVKVAKPDLSAEALEIFNSVMGTVGAETPTTPASSKKKKTKQ